MNPNFNQGKYLLKKKIREFNVRLYSSPVLLIIFSFSRVDSDLHRNVDEHSTCP
jgi:hypothetical protein